MKKRSLILLGVLLVIPASIFSCILWLPLWFFTGKHSFVIFLEPVINMSETGNSKDDGWTYIPPPPATKPYMSKNGSKRPSEND